jgi:hypothetical protein
MTIQEIAWHRLRRSTEESITESDNEREARTGNCRKNAAIATKKTHHLLKCPSGWIIGADKLPANSTTVVWSPCSTGSIYVMLRQCLRWLTQQGNHKDPKWGSVTETWTGELLLWVTGFRAKSDRKCGTRWIRRSAEIWESSGIRGKMRIVKVVNCGKAGRCGNAGDFLRAGNCREALNPWAGEECRNWMNCLRYLNG